MVVTDYNEQFLDKRGTDHLIDELKAYIDGIASGNIDLSDYVTKSELQAKLDALHINIDLSSYATKEELLEAINNIDLSAYALKTEIPSLNGYATTEYVDNAVSNIPTTDLTNYYTKSETYSKTEVDTAISNIEGGEPTKDLLYESVIRQGGAIKSQSGSLENDEIFTLENYYGANYSNNTTSYVNEYITKGLYIYIEPEKILTHGYDMYGSEVEEGGYTEEEKAQHSIELANKAISSGKYKGVFAIKCTSNVAEYEQLNNDTWFTNNDLIIGEPLYVYGYVLDTFCGLSQGAYILKVIPSGTTMKKTDIVEIIPVTKERVEVPCNLSLVNRVSMFSTGESPFYKTQWGKYDTSRRCTDEITNEVITFPKGNDDSEFVLSRFGYPQYTTTNGVPQGIVLQGDNPMGINDCSLVTFGLSKETYVSGNPGIGIVHYSLDEWAKKIDDNISKEISDGISPTVSIAETDNGHTVSITDVNGTKSFDVTNGQNGTNGTNGTNGVSPTVTVTKKGKIATITCTDVNGTTTATISDGADGRGGSSSSGGGSAITYAYDTEIATGETWVDGKPIYLKVFHIDALASQSKTIDYREYHNQTKFADTIISVNPTWKNGNNASTGFMDDVVSSVSTSSKDVGDNVNNYILSKMMWCTVYNGSDFHIIVGRGNSRYSASCDVFVKYTKL